MTNFKKYISTYFTKRITVVVLLSVTLLGGCQTHPRGLDLTPTPRTLVYSYIIANGMARGRIMRGAVSHEQLIALAKIDRQVLLSILIAQRYPSHRNFHLAEDAVIAYLAAIES
ncbi:hypothetical protein [Acetobacter thailandicus]|uniref:hypothetical protein n=1 Tax=Acetobacter thailandicus TaxID=1502842 RepID=UPI001BA9CD8E|nr:hypothetical protein [Acetobacter thailandicus]MBS1002631.1 hypothetical protein [Acetobacter thailandicus]